MTHDEFPKPKAAVFIATVVICDIVIVVGKLSLCPWAPFLPNSWALTFWLQVLNPEAGTWPRPGPWKCSILWLQWWLRGGLLLSPPAWALLGALARAVWDEAQSSCWLISCKDSRSLKLPGALFDTSGEGQSEKRINTEEAWLRNGEKEVGSWWYYLCDSNT